MKMMLDLEQILQAMANSVNDLQELSKMPDRQKMGDVLMPVLEIRDLAREGQEVVRHLLPADDAQRFVWQRVRIGMTYLELAAHALVAAQPDSTAEEDQALLDRLLGDTAKLAVAVEEMVGLLSQIAPLAPAGQVKKPN